MFTVLEGVNGAGKSAVLKELTSRGFLSWEGPALAMSEPRRLVMESASPLSRFMFFSALNYQVGAEVAATRGHRQRVASRYFWSSVAYHVARESIEDPDEIHWLLGVAGRIALPDLVVQLDVSQKVQAERLSARNVDGESRYGVGAESFFPFDDRVRRCFSFLRDIASVPWRVIDTTSLTIEDVSEKIIGFVNDG